MEVQELLQFIREKTAGRKWDAETCLRVGAELAVKVNGISNLNGTEKKKLVVDLILEVLKEAEEKEKQGKSDTTQITARYDQLEKTVKDVLPTSLELIVSASRGKLDLKKVKPSVWMRYCSCFVKSVVTVLVSQKVISEDIAKKVTDATETVEEKAGTALDAYAASQEGEVVSNPASVALKIREVASTESSSQESKQ
jgi:hypothetical protein